MQAVKMMCGVIAGMALLGLTTIGCSSSGKQSGAAGKAIEGLGSARTSLVDANKQVDVTLGAMNKLPSSTDLKGDYAKFAEEVRDTEATAARATARAADMRKRGREYVSQWEDEMAKVTDPAMRASMSARQQAVRDNFNNIRAAARAAADAYTPYVNALKDVEVGLSLDLTPAGVKAAGPTIAKANAAGATLKEKIDATIAQVDVVNNAMAAAAPQK